MTEELGFAYEEYGMFGDVPISRQCFDDGAAVINSKVVDTFGAKPRVRYLTDYNIVIASKLSPINSPHFASNSQVLFDGILLGTHSFDNLLKCIKQLPRHRKDIENI